MRRYIFFVLDLATHRSTSPCPSLHLCSPHTLTHLHGLAKQRYWQVEGNETLAWLRYLVLFMFSNYASVGRYSLRLQSYTCFPGVKTHWVQSGVSQPSSPKRTTSHGSRIGSPTRSNWWWCYPQLLLCWEAKHNATNTSRRFVMMWCKSWCVAAGWWVSRGGVHTARYHLAYHWWYTYHWLRNAELDWLLGRHA